MSSVVSLNEMFLSLQGESTRMGLPCLFIRLAGCNLSCAWCDSREAAMGEGRPESIEAIVDWVMSQPVDLVEVTGGEPLMQANAQELLTALCDTGRQIMVETNGTMPLDRFDRRASYIVDIKLPDSGHGDTFLETNYRLLTDRDEVKFVIASRSDFDEAVTIIREQELTCRSSVIVQPTWGSVAPDELACWLLSTALPVRMGLQLHKIIWGADTKGV